MWWALGVVALLAVLSAYVGWTAHRVERVHHRAQSASRALDAHLLRRAAAAAVVAEQADSVELYAAARLALDAAPEEREAAENDLTRALITTSRRVVLARQVHTDLVRDALTARRRPVVRLLRLARAYERPRYFDIVEPVMPELPAAGRGVPEPAGSAEPVTPAARL